MDGEEAADPTFNREAAPTSAALSSNVEAEPSTLIPPTELECAGSLLAASIKLQRMFRTRRYRQKRAALLQRRQSKADANSQAPAGVESEVGGIGADVVEDNTAAVLAVVDDDGGGEARTKEETYVCASQLQAVMRGKLVRKQNLLPTKAPLPPLPNAETTVAEEGPVPKVSTKTQTLRKKKGNDEVHFAVADAALQVLAQLDGIFRARSIRIKSLMQTEEKRYQEKVRPVTLQRAIQAATAGCRPKFKATHVDLVMKQLSKNSQGMVDVKELESLMLFARRSSLSLSPSLFLLPSFSPLSPPS